MQFTDHTQNLRNPNNCVAKLCYEEVADSTAVSLAESAGVTGGDADEVEDNGNRDNEDEDDDDDEDEDEDDDDNGGSADDREVEQEEEQEVVVAHDDGDDDEVVLGAADEDEDEDDDADDDDMEPSLRAKKNEVGLPSLIARISSNKTVHFTSSPTTCAYSLASRMTQILLLEGIKNVHILTKITSIDVNVFQKQNSHSSLILGHRLVHNIPS